VARLLPLTLAGMLLFSMPAFVTAQGEHARRAAAELLVLRGDLIRLRDVELTEKQRRGLQSRSAGSLSGLRLLLRLADQERGAGSRLLPRPEQLRGLLVQRAYDELIGQLTPLIEAHPLSLAGLLPVDSSPQRLARAASLHRTLCAACHDTPVLDTERPAYNLFEQARQLPLQEFTARMLVGIRGDRVTGIDNPFTDSELNALLSYYRIGAPAHD